MSTKAMISDNSVLCEDFMKEEFSWRCIASGIWMLFVFPFVLVLFCILQSFSIYAPLQCFTDSFAIMLSFSALKNFLLLQACCMLFTLVHARSIKVTSGIDALLSFNMVFNSKQILKILIRLISIAVCCMTYQNMVTLNNSEIVDNKHFFTFYWVYLSIYYTVMFYCNEEYILFFPVVQQKKFFRLKKAIPACIYKSFWFTVKMLKYYYLSYYICGYILKITVANFFGYEKNINSSFCSSICGIFNISILWTSFSISFATIFMLQISNELVHIFNTQAYTFQMTSVEKTISLVDAMDSSNILLKSLGFMDFSFLSKFPGPQRSKMYELSSPGNQPHTWNQISYQCNQVLVMEHLKLKQAYEKKHISQSTLQSTKDMITSDLFSSTDERIENLPSEKVLLSSPYKFPTSKSLAEKNTSTKPNDNLFNNFNVTIWCVEGLCNLIAASLKEDHYGVVQQNLPEMLTNLLSLLEVCELLTRNSNLYSISLHQQNDIMYASQLKIAIKTGLYAVTTEFGYYISAVVLSADHKKKMHEFLEFAC